MLTPQEIDFIIANHKLKSVPQMAKELKRGYGKIAEYMDVNGLQKLGRVVEANHPFKRANRALSVVCVQRKIDNRKINMK